MLTKQPRSSFLERNIDMMAVVGVGGEDDCERGVVVVVVEVNVGALVFFGDQRVVPSVGTSPSIFIGQCAAEVYDSCAFLTSTGLGNTVR